MLGTGDGTVVTHVVQLPGQPVGELGLAGEDKPGSSIRVITRPWWQYIGAEVAYMYLFSFFGILGMDGMGLVELAPAEDAFDHLYEVAMMSLAPTLLALGKEVMEFLGKIRASRAS